MVGALQQARRAAVRPFRELISRNQTNWAVVAAPSAAVGGDACFPDLPAEPSRSPRLWDAIGRLCRLDRPDPVAAWEAHLRAGRARAIYLNASSTTALEVLRPRHRSHDRAARRPHLGQRTIAEPRRHSVHGRTCRPKKCSRCRTRIASTASSDRPSRSATAARSSRTSACGSRGDASSHAEAPTRRSGAAAADRHRRRARRGSAKSRSCRTARRSRSRALLFYNTLFDENAASHVALGSAYKFTLSGGESMDDEDVRAGRRQPQRRPRRLHDRIRRRSTSTASARRFARAAHA